MFDPLLKHASRHRLAAVVLALLAASALMLISEMTYRFAEDALVSVRARHAARFDAIMLRAIVVDAETAQRGFLLTGREEYLKPLTDAQDRIPRVLDRLAKQYEGSQWHALMGEVKVATEGKLSELYETLSLYRSGNHQAWQAVMSTDYGREKMEALRVALTRIESHERDNIASERDAIFRALAVGRFGVHSLTVFSLLWLLYFLRKNEVLHRVRQEHAQNLRDERDRLDGEVKLRTAELTDLARHLQRVREDERAHLARELHDELGALLTAAKLDVARVRRLVSKAAPANQLDERMLHMSKLIDEGITLKRRIIEDLRPSSLSNLGLTAALEILTREFAERSDLAIETEFCEVDADGDAKLVLYRLVQESLTNVMRHALARTVWVKLAHDGRQMVLSIRDDGRGFDPGSVPVGHHGVLGMRYRVESIGGSLRAISAPGQGTEIEARLPFEALRGETAPGELRSEA